MTNRNWPLLTQVLQQIMKDPASWQQGTWATRFGPCGTAYCVAGHAIALSGYEFVFGAGEVTKWVKAEGALADRTPVIRHAFHGLVTFAREAGAALLGLEPGEDLQLFAPDNPFSVILAQVNAMATEDEFTLPEELRLSPEDVQYILTEADDEELREMDHQLLYPPIEVQR